MGKNTVRQAALQPATGAGGVLIGAAQFQMNRLAEELGGTARQQRGGRGRHGWPRRGDTATMREPAGDWRFGEPAHGAGSTSRKASKRALGFSLLYEKVWLALDELYRDSGSYWGLTDLYVDEATQGLFAVVVMGGGLYRVGVTVNADTGVTLGMPQQVVEQFETRTVLMRRSVDGPLWWFSISCTSVLNRANEIDGRALFQDMQASFRNHMLNRHGIDLGGEDMVAQLDALEALWRTTLLDRFQGVPVLRLGEDEFLPRRNLLHERSLQTGTVMYVAADENLLVTAGIFDDTPLGRMEAQAIASAPDEFGESIEFYVSETQRTVITTDALTIEVFVNTRGDLCGLAGTPAALAAAFFTRPAVARQRSSEEQGAMNRHLEQFLRTLAARAGVDEDDLDEFIADADLTNRTIEEGAANGSVIRRSAGVVAASDAAAETPGVGEAEAGTPAVRAAEGGPGILPDADTDDGDDDLAEVVSTAEAPAIALVEIEAAIRLLGEELGEMRAANADLSAALERSRSERTAEIAAAVAEARTAVDAEIAQLRTRLARTETGIAATRRTQGGLLQELRDQLAPRPFGHPSVRVPREQAPDGHGDELTLDDVAGSTLERTRPQAAS